MKKNDWILVAVILCVACAGIFLYAELGQKSAGNVIVKVDGEVKQSYSLSECKEVKIDDTNVFLIQDGKVKMTEADCPDKICVKHKAISKNKETIVCLPNKVVLEIVGEDETVLDAVVN